MTTPREVIADALQWHAIGADAEWCRDGADAVLSALAEAGITVARLERVVDPLNSVWEDEPVPDREPELDEWGDPLPPWRVSRIVRPAYLYRKLEPQEEEA